jgi:hypothetical protein
LGHSPYPTSLGRLAHDACAGRSAGIVCRAWVGFAAPIEPAAGGRGAGGCRVGQQRRATLSWRSRQRVLRTWWSHPGPERLTSHYRRSPAQQWNSWAAMTEIGFVCAPLPAVACFSSLGGPSNAGVATLAAIEHESPAATRVDWGTEAPADGAPKTPACTDPVNPAPRREEEKRERHDAASALSRRKRSARAWLPGWTEVTIAIRPAVFGDHAWTGHRGHASRATQGGHVLP